MRIRVCDVVRAAARSGCGAGRRRTYSSLHRQRAADVGEDRIEQRVVVLDPFGVVGARIGERAGVDQQVLVAGGESFQVQSTVRHLPSTFTTFQACPPCDVCPVTTIVCRPAFIAIAWNMLA